MGWFILNVVNSDMLNRFCRRNCAVRGRDAGSTARLSSGWRRGVSLLSPEMGDSAIRICLSSKWASDRARWASAREPGITWSSTKEGSAPFLLDSVKVAIYVSYRPEVLEITYVPTLEVTIPAKIRTGWVFDLHTLGDNWVFLNMLASWSMKMC